MSSRIKEMKTMLEDQNSMIISLRNERNQTRDNLSKLYQNIAKYKPDFTANATSAEENTSYPDVKFDDLSRLPAAELLLNVQKVFGVVVQSLSDNREELHGVYKELDMEVASAMETWNTIKAQDNSSKKRDAFLDGLSSTPQTSRTKTPELPITPDAHMGNGHPSGNITPDSTNKGQARSDTLGKSKNGTGTLGSMFNTSPKSPTTDKTKDTKTKASTIKGGKE